MEEVTVAEVENVDNNTAAATKMENVDNNLTTEILHEETDKESDKNLKEDAKTVENTEEVLEKNEEIFKIDKHEKETVEEEDEEDDGEIIPGSVVVDENTILFTYDTMLDESVEELYEPQVDIFSESFKNTGELEEQVDIDEPECIKKKKNYKHPCNRKSRSSKNRKSQSMKSMNNMSTRSRVNVNKIEEQILNKKSGHRKKLNGSQKAKFATQLENKLNSGNRSPNEEIIEEQCRVCLSKEAGLVNIFTTDKTRLSAAAKIMQIAPGVKIERKDSLPQRICNTCLESVNGAFNLKTLCECTDKDLRSRLQKAKVVTKSRRLMPIVKLERLKLKEESEESVDDEDKDANFKVESNVSESIDSDTDVKYEPPKKKKRQKKRKRMTRSQQKKPTSTATTSDDNKTNLPKTSDEDMSTKNVLREEDDETNRDDKNSRKSRAAIRGRYRRVPYECLYCKVTFPSTRQYKEHRKMHTAEGPFKCEICCKEFKFIKSFAVHLENHKKQDGLTCVQCDITFTNKNQLRRHMLDMVNIHSENPINFICERCNKSFTAKVELEHHQKTSCNDLKKKKSKLDVESQDVGEDLFNFVAPITTTYWSDSFSD